MINWKINLKKIKFVLADNVTRENLWTDSIHLKIEGSHIFSDYLLDHINNVILSKKSDFELHIYKVSK